MDGMRPSALLTVADLDVFADEASRMRLSLACLLSAMEDDSPIAWMADEQLTGFILAKATVTVREAL